MPTYSSAARQTTKATIDLTIKSITARFCSRDFHVRDTVFGVLILVLLGLRQRYALGIVTSVVALVPVGDMLTVLSWNGSAAAAFGIHGLTAVLVALTGGLLIREHSLDKRRDTDPVAVAA
ncbi:DUF4267 domain-containing protein [Nocardia gamkensis]|uniref:DUF4267 domain-containing protein n=1 Tax=Nocardia gamkensis TaxID=352869 RepID=UPI0036F1100E